VSPVTVGVSKAEEPVVAAGSEADVMRQLLRAQPKRTVRVRKEDGDQTVQINGYTVIIQAGVKVEVPEQVAQMLVHAGLI